MDKLKKCDYLSKFIEGEMEYIGIDTGYSSKVLTRSEFSDIRREKSYTLKNDEIVEFNFTEISEVDGKVVIYSEECPVKEFSPLLDGSINGILKLLWFLEILKGRSIEIESFSTNLFYQDGEGNPILLSPKIVSFLNSRRSLSNSLEFISKYQHPELGGREGILFSIGVLLYEVATGSYPYNYETVEELRDSIRRGAYKKPSWIKKSINRELEIFIESLLNVEVKLNFTDIISSIKELWEKPERENPKADDKELNSFLFKEKFRKNVIKYRGYIIGGAIALLLSGLFFGSIIYNSLQPPATAGFTSKQVVESYFSSIQTLDTELIEDCLKKGVKKRVSSEIASLFVSTQYKEQMAGIQGHYTPVEWKALPDSEKNRVFVYGIDKLAITKITDNSFDVTYEKWISDTDPEFEEEGLQNVFKQIYHEIFTLEETKFSYVISNVETLKEDRVQVW